MADIFISYARTDRDKIEKLALALEAEGYSVWWDRQMVGGAEFSEEIEKELTAAKAVIVAWSTEAAKSRWVKDEAVAAADTQKLIPISIDGTPPPMGFRQFHLIDLTGWSGKPESEAFKEVCRATQSMLTGERPAAAAQLKSSLTEKFNDPMKITAAAAVLAVIVVAIFVFMRSPTGPEDAIQSAEHDRDEASIAVLPFSDLSEASDQEYFADGIAEEILNALAQVDGLDVASRTSAFQFKGRDDLGVPEIAREINVRHVLEGSVRKAGNTVRITAQLIDAENDRHLWSDTFDRPLTAENLFAIQDEIASAIVGALDARLGVTTAPEIEVLTENLNAYELFLEARSLFQGRQALDRAESLLARAVEIDPGFAQAWAMRAAVKYLAWTYGYSNLDREEAALESIKLAERALLIDPDLPIALGTLANVQVSRALSLAESADWPTVFYLLARALDIEPDNASALIWRGIAYAAVGKINEALTDFEACIENDPLYMPCRLNRSLILAYTHGDQAVLDSWIESFKLGVARYGVIDFALMARMQEESLFYSATNNIQLLYGWPRHAELYEAFQSLEQDHSALAADILRFVESEGNRNRDVISTIVIPLGAFHIEPIPSVMWSKEYARYRQSQEFQDFIRRSGILAYWRMHGFPPPCQSLHDNSFECD